MSARITLLACSCLILGACVKPPKFKGDAYAYVESNYPIVNVNGNDIEPVYRLDMETGPNTVVIVYNTYQHDYYCRFSWTAESNTAYEVTDQENQYPLTLYRWVRTNSLWASRLDPLDPLDCVRKRRS
jgi:hypothetical protein